MKFLVRFFRIITIFAIIACTIIYAVSCLAPYINPIDFKYLTFLSLGFPYLLVAMLMATIVSFVVFKRYGFIFLLFFLLGFKSIFSTIGLHFNQTFTKQKSTKNFRVLSWNVCEMIDNQVIKDSFNAPRRRMMRFIQETQPDIICFQDFKNYSDTAETIFYDNIKFIKDTLKYPYNYFSIDNYPACKDFYIGNYGTIIFSRFPIIDTGRRAYDFVPKTEHLAYATMNIFGKKVRIYNTHLHSMYLKADGEVPQIDPRVLKNKQTISLYRKKMEQIRYYDSIHAVQAEMIENNLADCNIPFVFCADLNAVPSSYTYHTIKGNLKDPFTKHGQGWGQTYSSISSTLRIDVIFHQSSIQSIQYYCPPLVASDHYPVITDLQVQ
ncbi:MAG: endonuclease/exonuclease/phosphatase family protein [Chitinophagaceae bacterium]